MADYLNWPKPSIITIALTSLVMLTSSSNDVNVDKIRDWKRKKLLFCGYNIRAVKLRRHQNWV